ncbi:MAG TPA: hypothetical protein VGE77_09645 [Nocardioides sp.]
MLLRDDGRDERRVDERDRRRTALLAARAALRAEVGIALAVRDSGPRR